MYLTLVLYETVVKRREPHPRLSLQFSHLNLCCGNVLFFSSLLSFRYIFLFHPSIHPPSLARHSVHPTSRPFFDRTPLFPPLLQYHQFLLPSTLSGGEASPSPRTRGRGRRGVESCSPAPSPPTDRPSVGPSVRGAASTHAHTPGHRHS